MYTVIVNNVDDSEWRATYNEYDNALGALYELTEFGGEGCIVDESTSEVIKDISRGERPRYI